MADSLYLIDGHAQIYRAYYAPFGDLHSPEGEPTRATYVFMNMLFKLLQDRQPTYWAVALDSRDASASRQELFADYKANRDETPEDLIPQIRRIESLLGLMGLPALKVSGFEADDIIATIAERLREDDLDIYVVGKDKDLEQVMSDRVRLYDPGKDRVLDADTLEVTKGYRPDQVIEIQTLTGDKIDNIPGIQGVGVKTAARLIRKYGSARAVLEHADELTPKLKDNVRAFGECMHITRSLVTLRNDLDVAFDLEQARSARLLADRLRPAFLELGFNRLIDTLDKISATSGAGGPARDPAADIAEAAQNGGAATLCPHGGAYDLVDTVEALHELAAALRSAPAVALCLETVGSHPLEATLAGISLCAREGHAAYLPIRAATGRTLAEAEVLGVLADTLANDGIVTIGHDLKGHILVLRERGIEVAPALFDTMIASFLLNPLGAAHSIVRVAQELFGHRAIPTTDLLGRGRDRIEIDQVDSARACEYSAERADLVWRFWQRFQPQIDGGPLRGLFHDIEMPVLRVLADMERQGVAIDIDMLRQIGSELQARLDTLILQVHDLAGHPFNIDSPKQLAEVLFDEIGLRVVRRTKTGRSTDAETLSMLAAESGHALPAVVLEYRELGKLKSTYTDSLPRMVLHKTSRIHARFNTIGAVTGRLSSNDPNLQNIPVRTATGREIRRAFVPSADDHVLVAADYSQIELRLLAHFCGDERLLAAFENDEDIHRAVAAEIFEANPGDVAPEQRARAKAVNFGIIYGQTPFGLSRTTGMTVGEAKAFIHMYFMRYPGIRLFIDDCIERAEREGHARTIAGRLRPIPELRSRNRQKRGLGERLAVNTVLQGSAADLIKLAMIAIHRWKWTDAARPTMLIQVHDELIFEVPEAGVRETAARIADDMTTALELRVPLKVDVGWGKSWLECKA